MTKYNVLDTIIMEKYSPPPPFPLLLSSPLPPQRTHLPRPHHPLTLHLPLNLLYHHPSTLRATFYKNKHDIYHNQWEIYNGYVPITNF